MTTFTPQIKRRALELGFDLVGMTPAKPTPAFQFFQEWLGSGLGGTMTYLNRGLLKRQDPDLILAGVESVICCAMTYHTGQIKSSERKEDEAWISAYTWGDDYHDILLEKLKALETFIQKLAPGEKTKAYVDTGPVMEKAYAAQAGLGWIGKNTCLINDGLGSFIFLGEILTTLKLDYDQPALDLCGTCTLCLEACPTQALTEPYVMDARRCISYLTLEYKGEIAPDLAEKMNGHLAGCDICQEVCPHNQEIPLSPEARFYPREGLLAPPLKGLDPDKSPVPRTNLKQWQRNLKIASAVTK